MFDRSMFYTYENKNIHIGKFFLLIKEDMKPKRTWKHIELLVTEPLSKGSIIPLIFVDSKMLPDVKLSSITTDKRVYLIGEKVHAIIIVPRAINEKIRLVLKKENAQVWDSEKETDEFGVIVHEFEDLPDGEYELIAEIRRPKEKEVQKSEDTFSEEDIRRLYSQWSYLGSTRFSVTEYKLSPLRAKLENLNVGEEKISAELKVTQMEYPYSGHIKIGIRCNDCGKVVKEIDTDIKRGNLFVEFLFGNHNGPFDLDISTPTGLTANVSLLRTKKKEAKRIKIADMGLICDATLAPSMDATKIQGMYISKKERVEPITISNIIGKNVALTMNRDILKLGILTYNPITKKMTYKSYKSLQKGNKVDVRVHSPLQIIFVGAALQAGKGITLFETYATVFNPEIKGIKVESESITDKQTAKVKVKVESDESLKVKLLVIALDARLQRDDEELNIGRKYFEFFSKIGEKAAIIQKIQALKLGIFLELKYEEISQLIQWYLWKYQRRYERYRDLINEPIRLADILPRVESIDIDAIASVAPRPMITPVRHKHIGIPTSVKMKRELPIEVPEVPTAVALQQELEEPLEVIDFKILEVETNKEEIIDIFVGEAQRTVRVDVIAVCGSSVLKGTADISIIKDNEIKINAPQYIAPNEKCLVPIYYTTAEDGKLFVNTYRGQQEFPISKGQGFIAIEVDQPTDISATLISNDDVVLSTAHATIKKVGTMEVEFSDIHILRSGMEIEGDLVVYPSVKYLVKDIAMNLVKYPHGCAEQTSAKLKGLLYVLSFFGNPEVDIDKIRVLVGNGVSRMKLFFKQGMFSLWEDSTPSTDVTVKVLKNLMPAMNIDDPLVEPLKTMIKRATSTLLRKNVKDSELAELDKRFIDGVGKIEDAAHALIALRDEKNNELYKKALDTIKKKMITKNGGPLWRGEKSWAGDIETTCLVLRALYKTNEMKDVAERGLKTVLMKLVNGMLYSTSDTAALLDLLITIEKNTTVSNKIIVDGVEKSVSSPIKAKKAKALHTTLVRRFYKVSIDELDIKEPTLDVNLTFEGKNGNNNISVGDIVKLRIDISGSTRIPITKVFLPPTLVAMKGGANVQAIIADRSPVYASAIAVREGNGKIRVFVRDMYRSDIIGFTESDNLIVKSKAL